MDDTDYGRVLFGANARHVPAWLYVQNHGEGLVSFVGASRTPSPDHPFRYGSERAHQFITGELLIRPHLVVATDTLRGKGLGLLSMNDHNLEDMLRDGEIIHGPYGRRD